MNKYLNRLLYGKQENRLVVEYALAVPDATAVLDAEVQGKPHLAVVNGVLYLWNPSLLQWNAYQLIPMEILTLETVTDTSYLLLDGNMIDMIVIRSTIADLIHIGTTPGGDELSLEPIQLEANKWLAINIQIIANGADQTIYLNGFTGAALIKIYKRKLLP